MEHTLDVVCAVYQACGLQVYIQKTEIIVQTMVPTPTPPEFYIHGSPVKVVQHFSYLGSILTPTCLIDSEIQARINLASSAFGKFRARVFGNKDLRTFTKAAVYQAVCVSTLLFGAEAWTPYRRHIRCLEGFHIRCLQRILGVTWKDKISHTDILQRTNSSCMEAILAKRQLRWVGHVIRMPSHRLPRQVLYGQIHAANRRPGGQKRRYKDHLKENLKSCGISPGVLETKAANCQAWSSECDLGAQQIELKRAQHRTELHQRRLKAQPQLYPHPESAFTCHYCSRTCGSLIGLHSHLQWHRRQQRLHQHSNNAS
ncbi:uncharacterized protein LOC143711518 [Siphateles boraxobius]|uniref:uncharacterized protein LOC143711518 n=1 Tax=Siphateles boraxobius TaxID=180520 RepID=UPI004062EF7D